MEEQIDQYLHRVGLDEWLVQTPCLYIGGSFVSYMFAQWNGHTDPLPSPPNDLDIYTTSHLQAIQSFNERIDQWKILDTNGSIINFISTKYFKSHKVQLITAETDNFMDEVLGLYDCSMVAIGYHPASHQILIHPRFTESLKTGVFTCDLRRTTRERQVKLTERAHVWYHRTIAFSGDSSVLFDPTSYYASGLDLSVLSETTPPKYLQLFHHLYRCLVCHSMTDNLICTVCQPSLLSSKPSVPPVMTVIGGLNGFGKIIADLSRQWGSIVHATGRHSEELPFHLGQPMSQELLNKIDHSSVLVLNATKTLDGDETVWNTHLSTTNVTLLWDRLQVNLLGYLRLVQELCGHRTSQMVNQRRPLPPLTVVYVDANESKNETKMVDGKHLELNIAKSAVKQIFYTNVHLLTKLNMKVICYDPGWLSYHGISLEQKRARSQHLIPPMVSVQGLLFTTQMTNKLPIRDYSVYEFIQPK